MKEKCNHSRARCIEDTDNPRIMWCPKCGAIRIDEADSGEYQYTDAYSGSRCTGWSYTKWTIGKWKTPRGA